MKRLKQLDSQLLQKFEIAAIATDVAFEKRARSQTQKMVNVMCSAEAAVIFEVARSGTLDEKIALEYQLQLRDLEKYARSDREMKNVRQGLKDLDAGLVAYADLIDRPDEYRKQAAGYTDRNRDAKLDVPKDGMRYAVASQATRLRNRLSLQLSEEEKVLLTARRALLDAMQKEYAAMQLDAVRDAGAE